MSDAYSANTSLLLHMEGSDGSTTFTDNSLFPTTATPYGNAKISTDQSKWGSGSGYFDGSGDYLITPSNGWYFATDNFTIEFYINALTNVVGWPYILATGRASESGIVIYIRGAETNWGGAGVIDFYSAQSGVLLRSSTVLKNTGWHHVAFVRNGLTTKLFVDGVQEDSHTATSLATYSSSNGYICRSHETSGANETAKCYLQDLRITKGVARYTTNFTPPSRLDDPTISSGINLSQRQTHDVLDGGTFCMVGSVKNLGVGGIYRVQLFDRYSKRLVRETWSDSNGNFAFNYQENRASKYFAIAFKEGETSKQAAIRDFVSPKIM